MKTCTNVNTIIRNFAAPSLKSAMKSKFIVEKIVTLEKCQETDWLFRRLETGKNWKIWKPKPQIGILQKYFTFSSSDGIDCNSTAYPEKLRECVVNILCQQIHHLMGHTKQTNSSTKSIRLSFSPSKGDESKKNWIRSSSCFFIFYFPSHISF